MKFFRFLSYFWNNSISDDGRIFIIFLIWLMIVVIAKVLGFGKIFLIIMFAPFVLFLLVIIGMIIMFIYDSWKEFSYNYKSDKDKVIDRLKGND